jgi:AbiV family abortive infection protein
MPMRKPRQTQRLCELADDKLFSTIAEGINLILENAQTYLRAAETLAQYSPGRAVEHLRLAAEEEAAKVLILLDAVRCPRVVEHDKNRARTFGYAKDHVARGVYAWYSSNRPATFKEARRIVHAACRDRYYDGPIGDEFECRNSIESLREESLYVDYVEDEGRLHWISPSELCEIGHVGYSMVLDLAQALTRLGCGTPDGIRIVADVWRPIVVSESTPADINWPNYGQHNIRTFESLENAGLTKEANETDMNVVFDAWNYPLYSLNFYEMKTSDFSPDDDVAEILDF